jgi:vitamin B12 transporter
MNQAGGAFDFAGLNMADVERIEVVRGPSSSFYGSDAMAGVIHVITRRGRGPLKASLSTSGGSYGRLNWSADLHGGSARSGYSFSLTREKSDGILEFNNEFQNTVFSGKVFLNPDRKTRLELSGRYADRSYHFPTDGAGNVVDRNAFSFGEEWGLKAEAGRMLSDRVEVLAVFKTHSWDGGSDDRPDSFADTIGYYGYVSQDDYRRTSGDFRANLVPWAGSVVSLGVELETEDQDSESESFSQWGPTSGEDSFSRSNRGYYAHLVTAAGGWAGNLGFRVDDSEQYGEFLTYQAGLSYSLPYSGTRFRGSFGKGLKEPTFFETSSSGFSVGNPDLKPERSWVWEMGVEQMLGEDGATASLTWFSQSFQDLIQYTFMPPDPGGPNYFNVAEARARGLEAALSAPIGDLTLSGSYTYLDSGVKDAGFDEGEGAIFVEGEPLIRRPRHMAALSAAYHLPRGAVTGGVRWTGKRSDRDFSGWPAAPVELGSHTLLSLGMEFQLLEVSGGRPGLALRLRGENLLDEEYQEMFGFAAPGRVFLIGARLDFGR